MAVTHKVSKAKSWSIAHTCNLISQEVKAGRPPQDQDHLRVPSEFNTNLNYLARVCLRKTKKQRK